MLEQECHRTQGFLIFSASQTPWRIWYMLWMHFSEKIKKLKNAHAHVCTQAGGYVCARAHTHTLFCSLVVLGQEPLNFCPRSHSQWVATWEWNPAPLREHSCHCYLSKQTKAYHMTTWEAWTGQRRKLPQIHRGSMPEGQGPMCKCSLSKDGEWGWPSSDTPLPLNPQSHPWKQHHFY